MFFINQIVGNGSAQDFLPMPSIEEGVIHSAVMANTLGTDQNVVFNVGGIALSFKALANTTTKVVMTINVPAGADVTITAPTGVVVSASYIKQAIDVTAGLNIMQQLVIEVENYIATMPAGSINDTIVSTGYTWSSQKINTALGSVTGAVVVELPTVTGSLTPAINTATSYTATAKPLLDANVSIASFTFVFDGGTPVTVPATNTGTGDAISGSATTSYTWTGTAGSAKSFTVYATDSMGNKSAVNTVNVTLTTNQPPTAPTITASASVTGGSTGNQVSFSGSTDPEGQAITYSISNNGGITFSKTTGIASGEIVTYTAPTVSSDTQYTFQAVAVDSKGGQSTATSKTVTVTALPAVGGAYGGGYYVGKMVENGITYALVVAPKASGYHYNKQWKTTNNNTSDTASYFDGLANSNAMNNAEHPAAQWCRALTIGGFNDWYLPARDELELCYRNLKPTTHTNATGARQESGNYGDNANSLPVGTSYTIGSPAQTGVAAFKTGGSEAFSEQDYWSSTQYAPDATFAWNQLFRDGRQEYSSKSNTAYVRAVRKIAL